MRDEDRWRRLLALEERIRDPRSVTNIDCLLDTVQALVLDCDHTSVKRMKNIEAYMNRCKCSVSILNATVIVKLVQKAYHFALKFLWKVLISKEKRNYSSNAELCCKFQFDKIVHILSTS